MKFIGGISAVIAAMSWLVPARADDLPTAQQVAARITLGWNLGNTLEAQCAETAWGNPPANAQLFQALKAAGFNAVRLPTAWDCHADAKTQLIDPAWMARVRAVVDLARAEGLYVLLNIHWDGGWLENHPLFTHQQKVNAKQRAYWTQIANAFKEHDEHLLFAGTNEVHADYGTPTAEHNQVQQSYNQTFVDAVRATGGRNATRTLVVQSYNTNIHHGLKFLVLPRDSVADRLMVEVHHYDPYDYTLNEKGRCLFWGKPYPKQEACSWAQERYHDATFASVRSKWIDAGVPVLMGEYTVGMRPGLDAESRLYYLAYVNAAAAKNGIRTFYWDIGVPPTQKGGNALFDRRTGEVVDAAALQAIRDGWAAGVKR
jgi:endoglucanase